MKATLAGTLKPRRAETEDHARILELLAALDLDYPARDLAHFWVYADAGYIAAIAELKRFPDFFLLSCVGVDEALQGTGMGRAFITEILDPVHADVFLYTLVPGFFQKAGFHEAREVPASLPPRSYYNCQDCVQQGCTCMVRRRNASGISSF
jgi:N-acetylglutamate synthase-like GNAT family acetyltransferase